jgi:hypothetical protein
MCWDVYGGLSHGMDTEDAENAMRMQALDPSVRFVFHKARAG